MRWAIGDEFRHRMARALFTLAWIFQSVTIQAYYLGLLDPWQTHRVLGVSRFFHRHAVRVFRRKSYLGKRPL
jgi:hypothetical protein